MFRIGQAVPRPFLAHTYTHPYHSQTCCKHTSRIERRQSQNLSTARRYAPYNQRPNHFPPSARQHRNTISTRPAKPPSKYDPTSPHGRSSNKIYLHHHHPRPSSHQGIRQFLHAMLRPANPWPSPNPPNDGPPPHPLRPSVGPPHHSAPRTSRRCIPASPRSARLSRPSSGLRHRPRLPRGPPCYLLPPRPSSPPCDPRRRYQSGYSLDGRQSRKRGCMGHRKVLINHTQYTTHHTTTPYVLLKGGCFEPQYTSRRHTS